MNAREFRESLRNYKDDELALQALEAVCGGYLKLEAADRDARTVRDGFVDVVWSVNAVGHGTTPVGVKLTDGGRAKLAELREKKGRGE